MLALAAVVGLVAMSICVSDWRRGMLLMLLAGFVQDPIRKLVPGEPVYLVMVVGLFFAGCLLGALNRGMSLSLSPLYRSFPPLALPLTLFVALVVGQIMMAFLKTGSVQLAAIGAIAYLSPIAGIALAFHYGRSGVRVVNFLHCYVAGCVIMASGVYLGTLGVDWRLLDSVGSGLYVFPDSGGVVKLPQGFFRSPEIAAWHGAAAVALVVTLALSRAWRWGTVAAVLVVLFLVGAVLLTGRRKALMELLIFGSLYAGALLHFRQGAHRLAGLVAALGLVAMLVQTLVFPEPDQSSYSPYLERSKTTLDDAVGRFKLMTVDAVEWTIRRNGWWGAGAGTGSQGAQHFGGGASIVGGGGEGGVGKILGELGLPAIVLLLWFGRNYVTSVWYALSRRAQENDPARLSLCIGFATFLCANITVFMTASQVFGDPFVLIMLGLLQGFMLAALAPAAPAPRGALSHTPEPQHDGRHRPQGLAAPTVK